MPGPSASGGTASTTAVEGIISGHVLRLIRERLGLTREALAEHLSHDVNTVRGWESGRRPLLSAKGVTLIRLERRLQQLGATSRLLDNLRLAQETDLFVVEVLEQADPDPADHTLATLVTTRAFNDLLAWLLVGKEPQALLAAAPVAHRGAALLRPTLPVTERRAFFDSLRRLAERALASNGDPGAVLLRRQAYFLAAFDDAPHSRPWMADMEAQETRRLRPRDGWSPAWVGHRSLAVARSRQGDRDQLRHFIGRQIAGDDQAEAANLNYWAYWIGEHPDRASTDEFMATGLGGWRGSELLRHLTDGLDSRVAYVDLTIHSVWALLHRRPHLLEDPATAARLRERVSHLLDLEPVALGEEARRELEQIHYATIMTRSASR